MEAVIMDFIQNVMDKNIVLVYGIFFLSAILQMLFPPHPGDVILVFQGFLTTTSENFHFVTIFMISLVGTFIGSYCLYKLGYTKGQKVFEIKLIKRFVKIKNMERAKKKFEKYGLFAIILSKFVPGMGHLMVIMCGIFKIKPRAAYKPIIASIIIHDITYILLGRFMGSNMEQIKTILATYNAVIIVIMLILGLVFAAYRLIIWQKARKVEK